MPIYPYVCSACGHEFDMLQKVSEDALKHCPECGEHSLRKKLTAAAFHLKGTGWYETDFKNKGTEKDQKEDQKPGQKEAGKDDAKGKKEGKKDDSKASDKKSTDKTPSTTSSQSKKNESKKADSN